jgi:hypothetical protein
VLEGFLVGIIDASLLRKAMQSCSGVDTRGLRMTGLKISPCPPRRFEPRVTEAAGRPGQDEAQTPMAAVMVQLFDKILTAPRFGRCPLRGLKMLRAVTNLEPGPE